MKFEFFFLRFPSTEKGNSKGKFVMKKLNRFKHSFSRFGSRSQRTAHEHFVGAAVLFNNSLIITLISLRKIKKRSGNDDFDSHKEKSLVLATVNAANHAHHFSSSRNHTKWILAKLSAINFFFLTLTLQQIREIHLLNSRNPALLIVAPGINAKTLLRNGEETFLFCSSAD